MANEAVLMFETSLPIPFIVANATGIEQGAVLKLTDPFTAIITSANDDMLAGIAAAEKIASDGILTIPVYLDGVFKMVASGNITAGKSVSSAGTVAGDVNKVYQAPVTASGNSILGQALETAVTGDSFLVHVNVGSGGNHTS